MKGSTPSLTPSERHLRSLLAAFELREKMASVADAERAINVALSQCRDAIVAGVPCGDRPAGAAEVFISRTNWYRDEVLWPLFQQYIEARFIDPNALLVGRDVDDQGMLPLELAITVGNLGAAQAFMDAGADHTKVPSRDWSRTQNTRTKGGKPIADVFSFIDAKVPDPQGAGPFKAMVTEMSMRKRVAAVCEGAVTDRSPTPARRLRAL
ncbi:hypothetical protein [Methylibium petroleiphilum]|uniref:Ankyrin repeat domain-containing protein n=1 Tax=Methylibium petroleiphilum (strain ATCC BAA-1232 / LMG 22953 / PM1) TaxID=420662 RepID=A2SPB0_METPP|nr:hypothetical protein [Methylibium petroleiphilum]ABM97399.1 hypothetical protein Mpe_B0635 [Methylibium petroleiphilum PM1]